MLLSIAIAAVLLVVFAPVLLRITRASLRLILLKAYNRHHADPTTTVARPPVPLPLPLQLHPEMLIGQRRREIEKTLGRPNHTLRLQEGGRYNGIVAATWDFVDPRLGGYFRDGICIEAQIDPNWHRRPTNADALIARFQPPAQFLGKSLEDIERIAGTCHDGGSFDFGVEAWDWRAGDVHVRAWFRENACTAILIYRDGLEIDGTDRSH